jgi:hypothetical protein
LRALRFFVAEKEEARTVKLSLADFNKLWSQWRIAHGEPKGLIVRASPRGTPTPKRTFDSDIVDYSFDRAVICDRARTADLLIANNFPFREQLRGALDGRLSGAAVRHGARDAQAQIRACAYSRCTIRRPADAGMAHKLNERSRVVRGAGQGDRRRACGRARRPIFRG